MSTYRTVASLALKTVSQDGKKFLGPVGAAAAAVSKSLLYSGAGAVMPTAGRS